MRGRALQLAKIHENQCAVGQNVAGGRGDRAHIANAAIRDRIERTCREAGYEPPIICTPEELME